MTSRFLENLVWIEIGCECIGWWRLRLYCEHFSWSKPCLVFDCDPECASLLYKMLGKFSKVNHRYVTRESFVNLGASTGQLIFCHLCLADQWLQTPLGEHSFFEPAELQTILKVPVINVNEFITWNSLQLCVWKSYILGTAVAQWLRRYATNRKVAGSIPDGAIGIYH